eukprot:TRINITY_DN63714_c0_g1_i1.p1 TRINITY_DN63714_c0_g1~~TRINITY_DN63714_c0_g1_i1.p1  ORF type:complete len:369 (-),score=31.56 TRINITY_DN63714_c0_g1_i1:254-1360(-)
MEGGTSLEPLYIDVSFLDDAEGNNKGSLFNWDELALSLDHRCGLPSHGTSESTQCAVESITSGSDAVECSKTSDSGSSNMEDTPGNLLQASAGYSLGAAPFELGSYFEGNGYPMMALEQLDEKTDALEGTLESVWHNKTSVMLRNVSWQCTEAVLRDVLHEAGFEGLFNYLYVPLYERTKTCKGYAYINFLDASTALRFRNMFHCSRSRRLSCEKRLRVVPANLQGYAENVARDGMIATASKKGKKQRNKICAFSTDEQDGKTCFDDDSHAAGFSAYWMHQYQMEMYLHVQAMQLLHSLPQDESEIPVCPDCGDYTVPHARFCEWCGTNLESASDDPASKPSLDLESDAPLSHYSLFSSGLDVQSLLT